MPKCHSTIRLMAFALAVSLLSTAQASQPYDGTEIVFDAACSIPCRDVTPKSMQGNQKVIEVVFELSPSLKKGDLSKGTVQYTITHDSPAKGISVADFLPKADLYSDVSDPVIVLVPQEATVAAKNGAAVRYNVLSKADAKSAEGQEAKAAYEKLPPKKALKSSKPLDSKLGVVFEMNGSDPATLKGRHVVSCLFVVPKTWRADCITLRCDASKYQAAIPLIAGMSIGNIATCGRAEFGVGLYLEGDQTAEQAAKEFVDAQQKFLDWVPKSGYAATETPFLGQTREVPLQQRTVEVLNVPKRDPKLWSKFDSETQGRMNKMNDARKKLELLSQ
jgi:hypothetical protein